MIEAVVTVHGKDLLEAGKCLKKASRTSEGTEALLTFADGELVIEVTGTSYTVPAEGTWTGVCRVGKSVLELMARCPKKKLSVAVMATDHLHIDSMTVECLWEANAAAPLPFPVNPSILELLRAASTHTTEKLAASGLIELVMKADAERAERISSAVKQLAPFGDCDALIREWVDGRIRDEYDYLQH